MEFTAFHGIWLIKLNQKHDPIKYKVTTPKKFFLILSLCKNELHSSVNITVRGQEFHLWNAIGAKSVIR